MKSNDDSPSNAKMPSITIKPNENGKIPTITIKPTLPKSKTQISSIYTKLSSIKPTTCGNGTSSTATTSQNHGDSKTPTKTSSIPNFSNKTVKTTQIGNVLPTKLSNGNTKPKKPELSHSHTKKVSHLVKPTILLNNASVKTSINGAKKITKNSESDGNSQSSLSSSDSSLNTNHQDLVDFRNEYNSTQKGINNC